MKLIYESVNWFRFYDFNVSHNVLLIRGDRVEKDNSNIDLVFEGTDWINCPTMFEGIKIYKLEPSEIEEKKIENINNDKLFMIITNRKEYFIKTGILRIFRNTLGFGESSIDLSGRGQEDLIWMSNN